jgi:hypothetical protein
VLVQRARARDGVFGGVQGLCALIDNGEYVVFDQVARTPPTGREHERKYQTTNGPPVVRGRKCTTPLVLMTDVILDECAGLADARMRRKKAAEFALDRGISEGDEGGWDGTGGAGVGEN